MAILTTSGRTALAIAVSAQPIHLAWGAGDPGWDTTPVAESPDLTALVAELGRRVAAQVAFVVPDLNGAISVPNGNFTALNAGQFSNNLYFRFNFDYADASSGTIREVGIFLGTTIQPSTPPGQAYFQPSDLLSHGTLLATQRIPRINRSPDTRQSFEFVLSL